ncbi:hypothetical protein PHET_07583 [Paragonimus heterotremus]|uniref:Uncharacterized protein n=1 Tax=Paragonimus heterotremus TaxID=100268 RepID=A0A8J4SWT0_9TREM|nr:hypothetical protein PHET_07583 [Paragonimus heterotremus]
MQTYHHLARIIWSKSALSIRSSSRLIGDHALKFQDETEPLWKNVESDQFVRDATHLAKYIVDYRTELSEKRLPVLPDFKQIEPGYLRSLLPNKAPEDGEDFDTVFGDFQDKVIPGVTHWQHPNFHAYFPTGSTYPSMLGDLLSSALAPVGVTWMACPACTELEVITLDWLVQALGLPEKFLSTCSTVDCLQRGGGTIESSASLACATLMMGLRENALAKLFGGGVKKTEDGLRGCGAATNVDRLVAYTSDQAHSSVTRAFRISMMRYREIPTKPVGRKRVFNVEELRSAMARDISAGLIPLVGENCQTESLYHQLLRDGRIFMSPGSVTNASDTEKSMYFLRFVASPLTTIEDVEFAYKVLTETVERSEYTSLNTAKIEERNVL